MSADTAVLVIDVQESFRHTAYYDDAEVPAFMSRLQLLIDGARAADMPIVQIFHTGANGPFAESSGFVRTMHPLTIKPDVVIRKRRHSALVGTDLDVWLTEHGIRRVIICGIRTEQCCETTARHASDLGYGVDYVGEATLTFAMTDAGGRRWSSSEIKARTELVLAGRFARVVTVEEALATCPDQRAA